MGCGVSKSSTDSDGGEAVTSSKLPPLVRRRLEEIKRRRKTAEKGALSKQVLLKESYHTDNSASHSGHGDDNGRKSLSSAEESLRAAKVTPEPEPSDNHKHNNKVTKEDYKPAKEETTEEQNEGEIEEEGEEDARVSNFGFNEYLCPGSPSFRVYIEPDEEPVKDDKDDESNDIVEETSQNSQADESCENVESVSSNEESAEMKREEHKKRGKRSFRRVMGKGKPRAVKNLLSAASCYHPHPSISRHDKARPLAEKAAA